MKKKLKILWVEDEDILREVMCELLESEGLNCVAVENGIRAKEELLHDKFDLLISDFLMPEMNGSELLFWCRMNHIHLPVIFVSGNVERTDVEELVLTDCCSSILQKPFSIETLIAEIEKAISRNHDFDCRGETTSHDHADFMHDFPGRHYLKD